MWKISENGKAAKILQKAFTGCLSVPQCRIMTELSLLRKYLCYKLWKCCTSKLLFLCWYNIQQLLWLPVDVRLFIVRKCPLFKLTNRSLTGLHGQLSVKKKLCFLCCIDPKQPQIVRLQLYAAAAKQGQPDLLQQEQFKKYPDSFFQI